MNPFRELPTFSIQERLERVLDEGLREVNNIVLLDHNSDHIATKRWNGWDRSYTFEMNSCHVIGLCRLVSKNGDRLFDFLRWDYHVEVVSGDTVTVCVGAKPYITWTV